jgi:hypothetical protein
MASIGLKKICCAKKLQDHDSLWFYSGTYHLFAVGGIGEVDGR